MPSDTRCLGRLALLLLQGVSDDAAPGPAVTPEPAPATAAGQGNGAALEEADVRAGGDQAGPSIAAANGEKAKQTNGDRHTGKPAGGGGAVADNDKGKGKAEKSKSNKAQPVIPFPQCSASSRVCVSSSLEMHAWRQNACCHSVCIDTTRPMICHHQAEAA